MRGLRESGFPRNRRRDGVPEWRPMAGDPGVCVFLDVLTVNEQVVYGQLAQLVLAADGSLHDKERAFRDRAVCELRLEALPEIPADGDVVIPDGAFRVAASRRALLLELALLAVADGHVSPEEQVVLEAVAVEMQMQLDDVERCVDYARRLHEVLDEGVVMLAEGH